MNLPLKRALPAVAVVALTLFGCSAAPRPTFAVHFHVSSDNGDAVVGAKISVRRVVIGSTDGNGVLEAAVDGTEGDAASVDLHCGEAFLEDHEREPIKLTTARRISKAAQEGLVYEAICTRKQRDVVIVAHAEPGIGLLMDGRQVAATNSLGTAQVLVPVESTNARVQVGFDTAARPDLQPRNPGRAYDLDPGDNVLVFEQKFTVATPTPAPHRVPRAPRRIPVRLD